jgi:hypothetical protein
MELVVLEQCLPPPVRIADVEALERQSEWCRQQYRVRHLSSLLSLDGEHLVCLMDAPDAESLRNVMRQLGQPYAALWAASVHAPPHLPAAASLRTDASALVVVERRFPQPVDFDAVQAIEERGAWCLEAHRVRFLRTYFARDRCRMICLYDAPDAESVRLAQTQAGMMLERVWAAMLLESPPQR